MKTINNKWWGETTLLTEGEERKLFQDWSKATSPSLQKELINKVAYAYTRLVISWAYKLSFKSIMLPDLIQEGFIGLLKAMKKFNPDMGIRFGLFASLYIKYEMYYFIKNKWPLVKLSKQQKERLGITTPIRLQLEEHVHTDSNALQIVEGLEYDQRRHFLFQALEQLDARSAHIVSGRWLQQEKRPLKYFAEYYKISAEAVRKIELRAIKKLKQHLSKEPSI
jgi:RNA polymerase sigma factor (sigma-70 family)